MDNAFEKIGVISYKKSKYANWFIAGNFVFFLAIGSIAILASDSFSHNRLNGAWCLLGCLGYIVLHEIVHLMFMRLFSKMRSTSPSNFHHIRRKQRQISQTAIHRYCARARSSPGNLSYDNACLERKRARIFLGDASDAKLRRFWRGLSAVFATRKYPASTFFQDNSVETAVYKKK